MPSATAIAFPAGTYPARTYTLSSQSLPDEVVNGQLRIKRPTSADASVVWNANTTVRAKIECSVDGGASWLLVQEWTDTGGIRGSGAKEVLWAFAECAFPEGVGRRVRGELQISGGPITSEGDVVWSW